MRQISIWTFFLCIIFTSGTLSSSNHSSRYVPEFSTVISSAKGDEMLRQCSRSVPSEVDGYFEIAKGEIEKLESNFKDILKVKATGCCLLGGKISNLNSYCYQYLGLLINNKRYIYINAFQFDSKDDLNTFFKEWESNPIIACDGGESYWGVLYEIDSGKFTQLSINGVA
jgi:hypothetical protein